jgi:hypothetical protein
VLIRAGIQVRNSSQSSYLRSPISDSNCQLSAERRRTQMNSVSLRSARNRFSLGVNVEPDGARARGLNDKVTCCARMIIRVDRSIASSSNLTNDVLQHTFIHLPAQFPSQDDQDSFSNPQVARRSELTTVLLTLGIAALEGGGPWTRRSTILKRG